MLHEIRHTKRVLVQQLVANPLALRDALNCQLHSHLVNLGPGHKNRAATAADLIFDVVLLQSLGHFAGFTGIKVTVE